MNARSRHCRPAAIAAAVLLVSLAGCGGLLPKPPERQQYRADVRLSFPPGLPHAAVQLAVATPSALDGLDTRRIALSRSPVTLDYYADGEWTDQAPFLVRAALVEGFEKSGVVTAAGPESLGLHADYLVDVAIRDFEAVYNMPDGPPRALVVLNLKLVRMPERKIVAQTVLRGEAPAAANKLPEIVAAFDMALSRAAEQTVAWTAITLPQKSRPR